MIDGQYVMYYCQDVIYYRSRVLLGICNFPYSTSENEAPPISRVLIGRHLIFCWLTSLPYSNSPPKCTPVKYKRRQKAGFSIVISTTSCHIFPIVISTTSFTNVIFFFTPIFKKQFHSYVTGCKLDLINYKAVLLLTSFGLQIHFVMIPA